jgi:CheY-like chemotaxis protein
MRSLPVVLVDDDYDSRLLLSSLLSKRGFVVAAVGSAASCLALLATQATAIVVTDIEMPGMSGIDLCRILRSRYPESVAIVMSGLDDTAIIAEVLGCGAVAFLPKPVRLATLESALRQAERSAGDRRAT